MSQDLWSLAAGKLEDKDRSHILHLTVTLEDLRTAVDVRQRECVEKQWSVNRRDDDKPKIILRDVFAKIAVWIGKFVEVGDVAVSYDPGHAALPWALVRFLLKVSIQDIQQYAVVAEGLEVVAKIVAQYKIVERLYLWRTIKGIPELQSSIVDLYVLVLKFLIRAQQFYSKTTVERALQNVFDFRKRFQGILDDIAKQQIQVKKYADLTDVQQRKNLEDGLKTLTLEEKENYDRLGKALKDIQQPISRMERQLQGVYDNSESSQRHEILQWLSPVPYTQHHVQSKRDILYGTGAWFLNDDRLIEWRSSSSSSILWLRGIAGSGKSKLISTFIEQQLAEFRDFTNPMPCYFYCIRNVTEPERANPATILRSLVRQLSCLQIGGVILGPVQRIYRARQKDGFAAGPLSIQESTALIIELSQSRQLTTIVIDALDECDPVLRGELFDALTEILQSSNGLIKILVSSRNERDIICELSDCLNLEIEAKDNQADITQFVNYEVDHLIQQKRLLYGKVSDDLRQTIKRVLCEKASGMFRWVSLQLHFLRTLKIPIAVQKRLGELPKDLRETYDETYKTRIKPDVEEQRSIAENTFKLLLSLQTPLGHKDFLHALSFCSDDKVDLSAEELLDLCCNFLVLDIELDVFRFAHLSVREYLETMDEYNSESSHALSAQICLRYLCTSNTSGPYLIPRDSWSDGSVMPEGVDVSGIGLKSDSRVMSWRVKPSFYDIEERIHLPTRDSFTARYPFLDRVQEYTCLYWSDHVAGSRNLRLVCPLNTLLQNFIIDAQQVVSPWFMYWNRLIIYMKANDYARKQISMPGWREDTVHFPADYLFVASLWGFYELLELRLGLKPDSLKVISEGGLNALQLVCKYGNSDVAKFLLDRGWALDDPSLLLLAITKKHVEIVRLLLSRGVDPNMEIIDPRFRGRSYPVHTAIITGSAEIVKHLLDFGASSDVEDQWGWKTFHVAAILRQDEITNLLLAASTDVDDFPKSLCREIALVYQALQVKDEVLLNKALEQWPRDTRANRYLNLALGSSADYGFPDACVGPLLAKGADLDFRWDWDNSRQLSSIGERLLQYGFDLKKWR